MTIKLLFLLWLSWIIVGNAADAFCEESFLRRDGPKLLEGEKPVQVVSVNRWNLLCNYVLDASPSNSVREESRADLKRLSELGFKVLRVSATLFWSKPMQDAYYANPQRWWARFDDMLDDCDRYGIRIVPLLNHHIFLFSDLGHGSLQALFRDRNSRSRKLHDDYMREIVTRYANRKTIYFWEVTNELNLYENLGFMDPEGKKDAQHLEGMDSLMTYPIVRSASNHITTEDSIRYLRETAELIRNLDNNHLIGSGHSAPRPAAMHLWRAQKTHGKGDWTPDSPEETAEYTRLTNPDPIDLISIHYYDEAQLCFGGKPGNLENVARFKAICDGLGKPIYFGEAGPPGADYVTTDQVKWVEDFISAVKNNGVPVTLFWTWNDPGHPPSLEPGRTDQSIQAISKAK